MIEVKTQVPVVATDRAQWEKPELRELDARQAESARSSTVDSAVLS